MNQIAEEKDFGETLRKIRDQMRNWSGGNHSVLEEKTVVDDKIEDKYRNLVENNIKKGGLKKMG